MFFQMPDYNEPVPTDPGEVLLANKLPAYALSYLEAKYRKDPMNDRAQTLYGVCLYYCDRMEEAEEQLTAVIGRNPLYAMAHHAYANWLESWGRFDEALEHFKYTSKAQKDIPMVNYGIAACLLRQGKFDEAWPFWEVGRMRMIVDELPVWEGQPLKGKKVLVVREGGIGDGFWLMRYFTLLREQGAHVTFYGFQNCRQLMGGHPWIDWFVDSTMTVDSKEFDYQISLMSIMPKFGICPLTTERPYFKSLHPFPRNGRTRIGLCWKASEMGGAGKRIRSCTLEEIEPLREIDAEWVNLQLNEEGPSWALNVNEHIKGWHKTCDMMGSLDAVVTVDTATAHLSGAMGKPTYLMLPLNAEWKWCFKDAVKSWYPSMTEFVSNDPNSMRPAVEKTVEFLSKEF